MSTWRFLLHRLTEKPWIRAALYAGFGIAMALLAAVFSGFVPDSSPSRSVAGRSPA